MKFIWEKDDIKLGRKYSKQNCDMIDIWIIGYIASMDNKTNYVSISLNDGMVCDPVSASDLADKLTVNGYIPVEFL